MVSASVVLYTILTLGLVIYPPFLPIYQSGIDDPRARWPLGIGHYQQASLLGHTQQKIAEFIGRVVRIRQVHSLRVVEHRRCFIERYSVLDEVRSGFDGVPLELVRHGPQPAARPSTVRQRRPRM